jgi:hypothetical protein
MNTQIPASSIFDSIFLRSVRHGRYNVTIIQHPAHDSSYCQCLAFSVIGCLRTYVHQLTAKLSPDTYPRDMLSFSNPVR